MVEGDAGATDAYAGAVPAHLALVCGVWGNVPDADVEGTIGALPSLLVDRGTVIWTRHRRPPDLTPAIRGWLAAAGFAELAFDAPDDAEFSVGAARLTAAPRPFEPGRRLFAFTVREEPVDELPIGLARPDEAAAILDLQRLAYRSEVARYPHDDIPPARQTLEELQAQMADWTFLVARLDGTVVGSVRARVRDDGTADVGRLIVHPRLQGRGLGTRLLVAVEAALPAARRFELFTGHRSARNLALYERLGYRRCGERRVSDTLSLVYLAKDGSAVAGRERRVDVVQERPAVVEGEPVGRDRDLVLRAVERHLARVEVADHRHVLQVHRVLGLHRLLHRHPLERRVVGDAPEDRALVGPDRRRDAEQDALADVSSYS